MTLQFWAEFLVSRFFFIVPMIIGGIIFWALVRHVSWGTGITHAEAKEEILAGNMAVAAYFVGRILGCALVVAGIAIAGAITAEL